MGSLLYSMIFALLRTFGRPWNFDDLTALKENQNTMHFGLGQAPPLLNNFGICLELGRVMVDSGLERRIIQRGGPTLVIHHPRLDHIVTFTAQYEAVQPASYDSALVVTGEDWELISDVKISLGGNVGCRKKSVLNLGEVHGD